MSIEIKFGLDEVEQTFNFNNATLQGLGDTRVMSVAVRMTPPEGLNVEDDAAVHEWLCGVFSPLLYQGAEAEIEVQVGPAAGPF